MSEIDTLIKIRHPDPKTDFNAFVDSLPDEIIPYTSHGITNPGVSNDKIRIIIKRYYKAIRILELEHNEYASFVIEGIYNLLKEYYATE